MPLRARLPRTLALLFALLALAGLGAGCGDVAGDGQTNPPSTSPK